jgi:outer membrane protein assembly factor BamB
LTVLLALTAVAALLTPVGAEDWPQWRGPDRDGVWHESDVLSEFPDSGLTVTWRTEIGAGYNGPTVAKGLVYVMDRQTEPDEVERILCLDEATGQLLWKHQYAADYGKVGYRAGPRASVTIDNGRAYALGAVGHLHCLDANSGAVVWRHDLNAEYKIRMPIWGIAASPLVFGDLVIVQIGGSDGACLVAFEKATGSERWRALDDEASYAAPIIVRQAEEDILVCWTGDSVAGLSPLSGKVHWRHAFPRNKMVISIVTPVVDAHRLFVTSFYDGSLMLKLHPDRMEVEEVWRRQGPSEQQTDALHSVMATPLLDGNELYGVDSYGELRCLDANTGDRIWEDRTATPRARWSNIHMVRNADRIWMFNERGDLIISKLSRAGFHELSRTHLLDPTTAQLPQRGGVCWAHPAYANRHIIARNDREILRASLAR